MVRGFAVYGRGARWAGRAGGPLHVFNSYELVDDFEGTAADAGWTTETNVTRHSPGDAVSGDRVAQFDPGSTGYLFGDSSGLATVPGHGNDPLALHLRGDPSIYGHEITIDIEATVDASDNLVDGYRLEVPTDSNNWYLYRYDDGAATQLASGWVDTTSGEWIEVEWSYTDSGHTISLSATGDDTISAGDTTYTANDGFRLGAVTAADPDYVEMDHVHVGDDTVTPPGVDLYEPFDSDPEWEDFFNQWAWAYDSAQTSIVDISGRSGNQLQVEIPSDSNRGLTAARLFDSEQLEVHQRYWIRFESGFQADSTFNGKLPGFTGREELNAGAGGNPADGNEWSARARFEPRDTETSGDGMQLEWYVYHLDQSGDYGDPFPWNFYPNENQWYKIDQYIHLGNVNTNDGILRAWVDDSQVHERTDLRFRQSGGHDVTGSWFDFFHGGSDTPNASIYTQYDDFEVTLGAKRV